MSLNIMENEKGLKLGIVIIFVLLIAMVIPFFTGFSLGPMEKGSSSIVNGVGMQLIGVLFLLSYFYSHKTFVFRSFIWICEHFSFPKGRKMAFFYFSIFFGFGTVSLIKGLGFFTGETDIPSHKEIPLGNESFENWWYKDPMLYIVILIIVVALLYRHKTNSK